MTTYHTPNDLSGKVALVTGGSRGIGRAIVLGLAQRGARVEFCYRADGAAAAATVTAAIAQGGSVRAHQADVSDPRAVDGLITGLLAAHGRIDILVNNAGHFPSRPVMEISDEEWASVLAVNLSAVFYCCRAVLPGMIEARDGAIINLASVAGQRGSAYHAHYAASKGGVLAFTRSVAREVSQYNVRVNAVSPGRVATDLLLAQADATEHERWRRDTPARRLGTPEEVAAAVIFLASDAGSYIMGETLSVNGGLLMD